MIAQPINAKNRKTKMCRFFFCCLTIVISISLIVLDTKTSHSQETGQKSGIADIQLLAKQGNAKAQYDLGMEYIKGQNIQQSYQNAREWFEKSAVQGYPRAFGFLGTMYQDGLGVQQDYKKALSFLYHAASKGDIDAMASLGLMYSEGEGVERNFSKALEFLRPSANAGNWSAQFTLGAMYADGRGVPQDFVEAHKWFNILASVGFEYVVEARERLANKMTTEQIAEAQRLAKEWKPIYPNLAQ